MTLYRHFGSKDDLILEYLNYKGRKSEEIWAEIEADEPGDPAGQLYGFIRQAAKFIAEDERGCDLANAAVELTEARPSRAEGDRRVQASSSAIASPSCAKRLARPSRACSPIR